MELANIVYSITLIFFLIICSIVLVGFLGSQYRKYQLNYPDKKMNHINGGRNTAGSRSAPDLFRKPVIRPADKIIMTRSDIDYSHITFRKVSRDKIKAEPVKKVKRGSLVKENYNLRIFSEDKNKMNKNNIDFN